MAPPRFILYMLISFYLDGLDSGIDEVFVSVSYKTSIGTLVMIDKSDFI